MIFKFHYIHFYFPLQITGGRLYIRTGNKPEGICVNSALFVMLILCCLERLFFQNICKVIWSIYEYCRRCLAHGNYADAKQLREADYFAVSSLC